MTHLIQWVAKAGLTLGATFNYKVLPEVTAEICYKESMVRNKNCIGLTTHWSCMLGMHGEDYANMAGLHW